MIQQTTVINTYNRFQHRLAALCILLCLATNGMAQSHSDLLILIDTDGIGYTAQLTVFADDDLIVNRLPPDRQILTTVFAGSGSALYRRAHEKDPDKLTLVSGSVFTRFRHRFTQEQTTPDTTDSAPISEQSPTLMATLSEFNTTMASAQSLNYRVSWVLPPSLELLGFWANERDATEPAGSWRQDNNLITFEQIGAAPTQLTLEYRVHNVQVNRGNDCLASVGPSEWCSPDADQDGVPDYRDICLPEDADPVLQSNGQALILSDTADTTAPAGKNRSASERSMSLGCDDETLIVLPRLQFESGQTYLNAQARSTLDKVAIALQRMPETLFRIATHTDNAGYVQNNQRLSENRAAAIRHYLMLRGLGPNQVQARGYGETSPAHDNRTAEGRRANRRVELRRLN